MSRSEGLWRAGHDYGLGKSFTGTHQKPTTAGPGLPFMQIRPSRSPLLTHSGPGKGLSGLAGTRQHEAAFLAILGKFSRVPDLPSAGSIELTARSRRCLQRGRAIVMHIALQTLR